MQKGIRTVLESIASERVVPDRATREKIMIFLIKIPFAFQHLEKRIFQSTNLHCRRRFSLPSVTSAVFDEAGSKFRWIFARSVYAPGLQTHSLLSVCDRFWLHSAWATAPASSICLPMF